MFYDMKANYALDTLILSGSEGSAHCLTLTDNSKLSSIILSKKTQLLSLHQWACVSSGQNDTHTHFLSLSLSLSLSPPPPPPPPPPPLSLSLSLFSLSLSLLSLSLSPIKVLLFFSCKHLCLIKRCQNKDVGAEVQSSASSSDPHW